MFDGPEDYHAPDRRSRARHHDRHAAVHARRRADRLSGRGRGREHAAAGVPASREGINALPCIGDGRQSGTCGSPVDPQRLARRRRRWAGWRCCETGDRVRIDLRAARVDMLIADEELAERRAALEAAGGYRLSRLADAVAGNPARRRRPDGHRRDPRRCGEVPAHRPDHGPAARQSLSRLSHG